jgi:hypothetical protein
LWRRNQRQRGQCRCEDAMDQCAPAGHPASF